MLKEVEESHKWLKAKRWFTDFCGKSVDLNGILLLIGIQEVGCGYKAFSKEEVTDLMHVGNCKLLSLAGYYKLEGLDAEGWPHWVIDKPIPSLSLEEQETLIKMMVVEYIETELNHQLV